jgi:WD repeat-containing protein 48
MDPHNQLSSQTTHAPAIHEPRSNHRHLRLDDLWEISCNDTVLPPNMTLAVVRQYVWRQSGEVVLHYRRRRSAAAMHGKD